MVEHTGLEFAKKRETVANSRKEQTPSPPVFKIVFNNSLNTIKRSY